MCAQVSKKVFESSALYNRLVDDLRTAPGPQQIRLADLDHLEPFTNRPIPLPIGSPPNYFRKGSFVKVRVNPETNSHSLLTGEDAQKQAQEEEEKEEDEGSYHTVEIPLFSVQLPEEILVDLMAERFALDDCQKGIIINGMQCSFANSYAVAMSSVLRALNNRRFIYGLLVNSDYTSYQEMLNVSKAREAEEMKQQEQAFLKYVQVPVHHLSPMLSI
ncbi:hypothetical protein Ciccas_009304 [Cichlidogyrus casuarinus]|uniref:Hydin adenylate kinase-like domain-containing protein n=1 Tax=Cichlidogyrus casuarinus TaxID=1844966 RepID=A0ABD2Q1V6_9PLAT